MKKLYFLFFLTIGSLSSAQIVNIPDANFKARLLSANASNQIASTQTPLSDIGGYFSVSTYNVIDTNGDGEIQVSEAQAIKFLNISFGLANVTGIEFFTNLVSLRCTNNEELTSLNVSGLTNLAALHCYINGGLTSLNVSGLTNLEFLECHAAGLTSLNVSGSINLKRLICAGNNLTSLFIKNNNINWVELDFSFNPNLQFICADEEDVAIVQTKINQYGYAATCHVNSYCSFTPGGNYNTISGNALYDNENDGCDIDDEVFQFLRVNLSDGTNSGSTLTNFEGDYKLYSNAGTFTLTPHLENPTYFNVSPATTQISFTNTNNNTASQDFCITPNGVHNDVEVVLAQVTPARPGFDAEYSLVYKNKGNQPLSGAVSVNFDDAKLDFVSSSTVPTSNTMGLLSWNYSNLLPFENRSISLKLNVNSPQETPAVNNGDVLVFSANITPLTGDEIPADNAFTYNQIVVGSYDPNDKTCLQGTTIAPSEVGKYVHYVIRFENTGTFAAENIVVKDMIDLDKFDIASFVPLNSSHDFYTRIKDNKVEFIFENINLPFDDATNDGYVAFKIKTKPTLVLGDTFSNSANIYFDYNFPIITDTYTTTIAALSTQDFDFGTHFTLYPNPAKEVLNIQSKQDVGVNSIEIYNQLGQVVMAITNFETKIDVTDLASGTYFVKINTEKGSANSKFVKE